MSAGQQRPTGLAWDVLGACFDLIGGNPAHGLPEPVAAYIRGEVAHLPASLGWIPDRMRKLLEMMPSIYAGNADVRARKAASASAAAVRPLQPLHFEPARPGAALSLAGELRIERLSRGSEAAWFTGTRAQIEAEGLTPAGLKWPQRTERVYWRCGPVQFHMSRCRPAGGPAAGWASGDCWRVVGTLQGQCLTLQSDVRRLRRELQAAEYRASDAGKRAASQQWTRVIAAASDTAFQGFMRAVLPSGFDQAPARRGRPAKAASKPEATKQGASYG